MNYGLYNAVCCNHQTCIRTPCIILWTYSIILSESPVWPAPNLGSIAESLAFIAYNDTHNTHIHTTDFSAHWWPFWCRFPCWQRWRSLPICVCLFVIKHIPLISFKGIKMWEPIFRDLTCVHFMIWFVVYFPFLLAVYNRKIHMLLWDEMKSELWTFL